MALTANEILVRMNEAGVYQGSHCKLFDTVTRTYGDAMSFETSAALGFPLHDILTQVETSAIIAADNAIAELATARGEHAAAITAKDAEIAALKAQIAELQKAAV